MKEKRFVRGKECGGAAAQSFSTLTHCVFPRIRICTSYLTHTDSNSPPAAFSTARIALAVCVCVHSDDKSSCEKQVSLARYLSSEKFKLFSDAVVHSAERWRLRISVCLIFRCSLVQTSFYFIFLLKTTHILSFWQLVREGCKTIKNE